jgi:hypothetical protein
VLCYSTTSFAQCVPDGDLPADFVGISPLADSQAPCDTLVPMEAAVLDLPYQTTITVFIPAEISGIALTSVGLALADAAEPGITGLPPGLTYVCDPPTCLFEAGVPGCVSIEGTVPAGTDQQLYDLLITADVVTAIISGQIRFPLPEEGQTPVEGVLQTFGFAFPECPYQISVTDGTANEELFLSKVELGQNNPNPFSGITAIPVVAEAGDYNFSVYNTVGELVHSKDMYLSGAGTIEFDASNFDTGVYFYTLSNKLGSTTKRMVVR